MATEERMSNVINKCAERIVSEEVDDAFFCVCTVNHWSSVTESSPLPFAHHWSAGPVGKGRQQLQSCRVLAGKSR